MRKVLIVIFLSINSVLSATNYYVKNSGSDSNSGLDDAHAWAHHPWMSTWTGSTKLVAGDNVFMKRGDTWSNSTPSGSYLTVGQSGSIGNPITTTWYGASGNKPLIQITGDYAYSVIKGYGKSFITFDHLDIKHFSSVQNLKNDQDGIRFGKDENNNLPHDWIITNCDIHNIPLAGIYGYDDSYNIIIGNTSATSCATTTSYNNHVYDCGYAAIILTGRNPTTNRSDFNVYYNYIHDIDNTGNVRDAYGITFSSNNTNGKGEGYSSGWPAYCTAKYNYVANVPGHEGIDCHGGTYIYIQDNYVKDCGVGVSLQAADRAGLAIAVMDHGYIERNMVENTGSAISGRHIFISVVAENSALRATNCYITDNTLFYTSRPSAENTAWAVCIYNADGITVDGNKIYNGPVGDASAGIGLSSSGYSKNILIRNNWIDSWDKSIYFPNNNLDGDIAINNNIVHSHQNPFIIYAGTCISGDDITIYNNTFLTTTTNPSSYVVGFGGVTINSGASLIFKNNILGITSAAASGKYIIAPVNIIGTFICDYNLFWNSPYTRPFNTNDTWANWNARGYDTHSLNNADPLFTNQSGLFSESINFTLKVTSPGINKGTVVSEVTSDFFGNARDATPDIGAYEYIVPVSGITVTGATGSNTITTDKGTLQLTSSVLPDNAANKKVAWSLINGTGQASINSSGLVTATGNGTVNARATATDGSGVYGTLIITISNQVIPVTGIVLSGVGGAVTITSYNGTLQLSAVVSPSNATNKTVSWSITNGTGQASISSSGLVTATGTGTVTARATATDGSGVYGTLIITIANQVIPVAGIVLSGAGGAVTITAYNGTLQLSAAVSPSNATNKTVTWSVTNGTGQATISSAGLVSATGNGTVTARATATDGSGVYGTLFITITNQTVTDSLVLVNSVIENTTPAILEVVYNIPVANVIPATSAFSVIVNSTARNINIMTISGTKVLLTLASPVVNSDIVTVAYRKPSSNPLQAASGGQATSVGPIPVTNKVSSKKNVPKPVKIFPNPAHDFINIQIVEPTLVPDFIRIIDLTGKIVYQYKVKPDIKDFQIPINLTQGVYIVQMESGNQILFAQKLIVAI